MWKILIAEYAYYKTVVITAYLFLLGVTISFMFWGLDEIDNSFPAVKAVMMATAGSIFIFKAIKTYQEKRDRMLIILPYSTFQVGISRLLTLFIFWMSSLLIVLSCFLFKPAHFELKILWNILSLSGFVFCLISVPFFYRDLIYCFDDKYNKITLTIIFTFIVIFGYSLFILFIVSAELMSLVQSLSLLKGEFTKFTESPLGAMLFILFGSLFMVLSTLIFKHRKSYVE